MPRLFAGFEVPAQTRQLLQTLQGGLTGARWIEPSDFHITLRFIGDIGNRQASEIDHLLCNIERAPISIKLTQLDSFGGGKPHSVFAQVEATRALQELQSDIDRAVRSCGAEPDKRKFQPHVTLARLRGATSFDVASYLSMRGYLPATLKALTFEASRFVLYSARASVGGGPYRVETVYPLVSPMRSGQGGRNDDTGSKIQLGRD